MSCCGQLNVLYIPSRGHIKPAGSAIEASNRAVPKEPKKSRLVAFWHDKRSRSVTFQFERKSRKTSRFVIFSNCKNSDIYFKPNDFCGWNQLSRVGHGQVGSDRPRLARPGIHSNHGPKPGPACEISFSPTVRQAPSARFHLAGRLPGL